jgi:AraC-like DNA-binding protein
MTIQQISDELNFPSQSFFGKYFKRLIGNKNLVFADRNKKKCIFAVRLI